MRAGQREPVQVLVDLADIHLPAADGVAVLTNRPHLASVNVGMAVGAFRTHIREDELGMACCTRHAFMHASQRELGRIVIEFRRSTDRLPALGGRPKGDRSQIG